MTDGNLTNLKELKVPHHMAKKESTGSKSRSGSSSHHYGGGPKTDVPHHMGPKKER
ncbi:hypothetical protein [Bradyrhizobium sp. BTAi1]|uniref:hypothetical protein n=1 Tax=Bradyrhizobium sp. (strain BTAi1 / ATCC BAA-1182) TaxID=288000 RepID=UPI00143AD5DE|nr:hypothetical protein [Bradyrhizobium sp. BTAi1]